jgi:hypothetical protein
MEYLRLRAFEVYLQHTLSCALMVETRVKQHKEHFLNETFAASEIWVRYCRNAQVFCGEFGLAALDRAECSLLHCLHSDICFYSAEKTIQRNLAMKMKKSASCYANAVAHQLSQERECANLWSFAGVMYDHVDAARFARISEDKVRRSERAQLRKGLTVEDDALTDLTAAKRSEFTALRDNIATEYDINRAGAEISAAYRVYTGNYQAHAVACYAGHERELQDLWRLCALRLRSTATEREHDSFIMSLLWFWNRREGKTASIAHTLVQVVRSLCVLSAARISYDVNDAKQQLSCVIRMLCGSPLVTERATDTQDFDMAPIEEKITQLVSAVHAITLRRATEQDDIQRFLAAADKVTSKQSPAHHHMKQCWRGAAEQMRMAAVATSATEYKQHELRSFVLQQLVQEPLTAAADYYAKADGAVSLKAKTLWKLAARALLEVTVPLIERCRQLQMLGEETIEYTAQEMQQLCKGLQLADEAEAAEATDSKVYVVHREAEAKAEASANVPRSKVDKAQTRRASVFKRQSRGAAATRNRKK